MNSNKRTGNRFEWELCNILSKHGYWAHNFAQNSAGQPADVIAVKDGFAELIDCKVCSHGFFSVKRIEENQQYSMQLWAQYNNGVGWFAVKFGENVYMATLNSLLEANRANLPEAWFKKNCILLEDWVIKCE